MSGNGNPECEHHLPTIQLTAKRDGPNQGRVFYKCAQTAPCRTFIWDDQRPGHGDAPPATPSSSQPASSSQALSTPSRKRAASPDDHDDIQSPFVSQSRGPFTPIKRVKMEASTSSLGQAWAPPSPATPAASQPSCSQNTVTFTAGNDDEGLEPLISRLADLPAYVKMLQRKRIAAEKSSEVKSRKIAELRQEVARLKAREQELEEALAGQS